MRKSFFNAIKGESKSEPPPGAVILRERPPQETVHRDSTARSSSVLGPNVVFKGELSAQEDLLIHGRIEGSIEHNAATLTIGTRADIKADIVARKIIVQGKVRGDMRASEAVIVEATAEVHGAHRYEPRHGGQPGPHRGADRRARRG